MNSRDRVFTAINHEYPDRIPKHSGFTPEIARDLKSIFNFGDAKYAIDLFFDHDILWYEIGMGTVWDLPYKEEIKFNKEGIYYDEYQIGWKKSNYGDGIYIEMVDYPLKNSIDHIENLKLPEIPKGQFSGLKGIVKKYGKDMAIIGGISSTVFEAAWYLRGQQQLLIDLIENPEAVDILMEKVTDYHLKIAKEMVEIGVDLIFLGDDVGAQDRPMISQKMIHKFLTPKYARIVKELREINPNIKFAFHCCGHVYHVLPELIEAGIDILQVIQSGSVDFTYIKKKYGKNISFWGGIDVQQLIPNGTVEQVVSNVKSAIEILGKNGGYIIGMSHNVQPGPRAIENIIAAYYAIEKFGYYNK